MDIRKAFKSRLLFVSATILVVFAATSLALKTTSNPYSDLKGVWSGRAMVEEGASVQLTVNITGVNSNGNISGTVSYKYREQKGSDLKLNPTQSRINGTDIKFFSSTEACITICGTYDKNNNTINKVWGNFLGNRNFLGGKLSFTGKQ